MRRYLAIDIGASSGRHIVGWWEGGELVTKEVHRFPNGVKTENGHLIWDVDALLKEIRSGIDVALATFDDLVSLSIDTWGCDYVLLDGDREILPCHAYRDGRTEGVIPSLHEKIPFSELYRRTGIQFQPFNTIYQLYDDLRSGRLEGVTDWLMIPSYFLYKLCGVKAHEYTNATTTGLVNAESGQYDADVIAKIGLPASLFPPLTQPGAVLGTYKGLKVVLCCTHDTASAVEGIPMAANAPYISSGTWSLLGVKSPAPLTDAESEKGNWSNEGGRGYVRYQKNIMGMWLVNRLRAELCPDLPFPAIDAAAANSTFEGTVDAQSAAFLAPASMKAAFDAALKSKPKTLGDYFRCAYRSLALAYGNAVRELEANTGETWNDLYIVGGGAKNVLLNRLTEEATGKRVIALPIEATAIGNLKIQKEADV